MSQLTDYLQKWTRSAPDRALYTFLDRACNPVESYTYGRFHARTNGLAHVLAHEIGVKPGEPLLLVYPPGLEIIVAFIACVKVGAIPVPVPAPAASALTAASQRLSVISASAGVTRALTDHSLLSVLSFLRDGKRACSAVTGAQFLPVD
jgi:acyl-CoA synthetase (AMP-forming)/AMP-acid ligase II